MAFSAVATCSVSSAFLAGSKVNVTAPKRTQKVARVAPQAKYGDESVYFDLDDVESTAGAWDMYGVEKTKRYPDMQSKFFENAADGLNRREAMFGFLAMGGIGSILVWGAKGSVDANLPITKGPQTSGEAGPLGKL
mmetsp:Transcript_34438/g.47716  ORF Transcript_34438/g.47716 Transcript_34438/m.47716 type:complete len:136 (+) Transcript_34438:108-515(+)|eukprot:CAMPEP_0196571250 /NCGR_PEP_ID=MMETSP1081-20130531/1422_1 /TAXON_ID=36882 /ORGANISM="Pyramimonas amylifera, Strain CCMP720" /LENGTH=135 /DNA_ID=CAMNT_0041888117 /DNA_START=107 /DNA_END=514 /DNA_ORIENTATION=+